MLKLSRERTWLERIKHVLNIEITPPSSSGPAFETAEDVRVASWRRTCSYGVSTIRDLIPYEFVSRVDLVLAPKGVWCHLELPADWLSDAPHPGSGAMAGVAAK
jgi:hypothetical protein